MRFRALRISFLLALILGGVLYIFAEEQNPWKKKALLETPERMQALTQVPNGVQGWPPAIGAKFPALELYDHSGAKFVLESLRGKPTLVEIVAMSCAGCQAFSGGGKEGGFDGFAVQADLGSIEEYVLKYGGTVLFSGDINFVQIIIYNLSLKAPGPRELAAWREHFKLDKPNTHIVAGGEALANRDSYMMIPGFLLLDGELTVRYSSTGHSPIQNLYTQLLPGVAKLLKESKS